VPVLRSPLGLKEWFGNVRNWLTTSTGADIQQLGEADGTDRSQLILHDGTVQRRWLSETDGKATASLYGKASGASTAIKVETTGEQDVVNHGKDSAGNIDPFRTNDDQQVQVQLQGADEAGVSDSFRTDPFRIPWQRDFPAWQDVDPVEIPVVEGVLWDPGTSALRQFEVMFYVVNNDAGAMSVTVSVGLDLGSGGSLAAPEYWMFNEVIPYPGTSGWRGPFILHADDAIRGVASAANDASIHFRIRRTDLQGL